VPAHAGGRGVGAGGRGSRVSGSVGIGPGSGFGRGLGRSMAVIRVLLAVHAAPLQLFAPCGALPDRPSSAAQSESCRDPRRARRGPAAAVRCPCSLLGPVRRNADESCLGSLVQVDALRAKRSRISSLCL
jgi:hypothetical protein